MPRRRSASARPCAPPGSRCGSTRASWSAGTSGREDPRADQLVRVVRAVISANTQARLEGYFRLEWKLAAQRTHTMADEKTFLLPVLIDGTRDVDAKVPAEFKSVQWTKLPGGATPPAFAQRVMKLLSREVGPVSDRPLGGAPHADTGQKPVLPQKSPAGSRRLLRARSSPLLPWFSHDLGKRLRRLPPPVSCARPPPRLRRGRPRPENWRSGREP